MSFEYLYQSTKAMESDSRTSMFIGPSSKHSSAYLARDPYGSTDYLQRTIGNQAVLRLICCKTSSDSGRAGIQTKLTVSQPGDRYEQEADWVAEQVMSMSSGQDDLVHTLSMNEEIVARKCHKCKDKDEEKKMKISRKEIQDNRPGISANVEQHVNNVVHKGGSTLEPTTRNYMESRFGFDFGNVRIHTDEESARSARALNALAYTFGNNIVFETGRYEPHRPDGMKLLAHELVHTIQQTDSVAKMNIRRSEKHLRLNQKVRRDEPGYVDINVTTDHIKRTTLAKKISNSGTLVQRICKDHSDESFYSKASNYCKDTGFSGALHPGRRCYREVPVRTGYWECPPGDQVCFGTNGACEDSYDNASPVEKKNPDGTCNLHHICAWTHHAFKDVIPEALKSFGTSIGEQQTRCHEACEAQPWYLKGFCYQGCMPMGPM
jgi:hypothetical protein